MANMYYETFVKRIWIRKLKVITAKKDLKKQAKKILATSNAKHSNNR